MSRPSGRWPPLIVAERVPRSVQWRDFLLTSIAWALFAVLLDTEFKLFLGDLLEWLGLGAYGGKPDWALYFELLTPFLLMAAVLVGLLVLFSVRTLRRRSRARLLGQPAPLEAADQARRAGLDEAALIAARDRRIVIVHIDTDGTHRIETPRG